MFRLRGTGLRRKGLPQASLSSSSSCSKSLQGSLKFLGLLQLEMFVPPNYLKLKVQNKSQHSAWKLQYSCCMYIYIYIYIRAIVLWLFFFPVSVIASQAAVGFVGFFFPRILRGILQRVDFCSDRDTGNDHLCS